MAYSNLGGHGPDRGPTVPPAIRFVNVGVAFIDGFQSRFDLVVTNTSAYTPYDASLNHNEGRFAQISFAANTRVGLRVMMLRSCCMAQNCQVCKSTADGGLLDATASAACYAAGCCCFGQTVTSSAECTGTAREAKRQQYGCARASDPPVIPRDALISFAVFDLDRGANSEYMESFEIAGYSYFRTPLRPSSGGLVLSTLDVHLGATRDQPSTFRSTAPGTSADNPQDPQNLTPEQASKAVQFFFRPQDGMIEANFSITYSGSNPNPPGRNLLFAGDSELCTPPPPPPPSPPSPPPPPPSPPSPPPPPPSPPFSPPPLPSLPPRANAPKPPPPIPTGVGTRVSYTVNFEVVVAGDDPTTLDEVKKAEMRAAIAAEAGVDVSRVRITVQLASLLVGFEIDVDSTSGPTAGAANALAVEERLAARMQTPEAVTAIFADSGVQALTAPSDVIRTVVKTEPLDVTGTGDTQESAVDNTSALIVLVVAVFVALFILCIAFALYCFLKRNHVPPEEVSTKSVEVSVLKEGSGAKRPVTSEVGVEMEGSKAPRPTPPARDSQ